MYRHAERRETYAGLASGGVLHSAPGFPAFPVPLADEILLRCAEKVDRRPLGLWDPLCGSGYLAETATRQVYALLRAACNRSG